jgi:hypothetical protein
MVPNREAVTGEVMSKNKTPRQLAQDPRTLPAKLAELAINKAEVHYELVQNPNTPRETLLRLGELYPKEFLKNPSLALFLLKSPNLWETVTERLALAILSVKDFPRESLSFFATHSSDTVRLEVLNNEHVTTTALRQLYQDKRESVRKKVAVNNKTEPAVLQLLAQDEEPSIRRGVAQNANASSETLQQLSLDESVTVRCGWH